MTINTIPGTKHIWTAPDDTTIINMTRYNGVTVVVTTKGTFLVNDDGTYKKFEPKCEGCSE